MKKLTRNSLILALLALTITSCSKKDDETEELLGNWVKLSDMPGAARAYAVSFTIGEYGYVGGGIDADNNILNDFWKYDTERNNWERIADFPGEPRYRAVAFSVKGKGYVGTGFNGVNRLNDFWAYDPVSNTWEQKTDFPGTARYGAVAMAIDTTGYVGTGFDGSYLKDFWAYYPESDTWEQKDYVSGSKRMYAVAFVMNGKGYICTGVNNGVYEDDLLEYNPTTGRWTEKRRIANISDDDYDDNYTIIRSNAVAFVIGSKAYITTGTATSIKNDTWEYDPLTDTWEPKTSFEGTARTDAVAFSINNNSNAYVVTGRSGNYRLEDIWEFKPDDEYEALD